MRQLTNKEKANIFAIEAACYAAAAIVCGGLFISYSKK